MTTALLLLAASPAESAAVRAVAEARDAFEASPRGVAQLIYAWRLAELQVVAEDSGLEGRLEELLAASRAPADGQGVWG